MSAPPPPYPGLASYGGGDDDAELFFGRGRERDLVIANLRAARMTVLYGPSGVGKSSLLHAGVVHELRRRARPEPGEDDDDIEPRVAVVIHDDWSGDPSERLAAKVRGLIGEEQGADDEAPVGPDGRGGVSQGGGVGQGGSRALVDAVTAYRAGHRGGLLLILDQFEEYLRLHADPREQQFDEALAELVRDPRLSVRVLIAIREDRLADLDRFGRAIPQLLGNVLRLGPLSPSATLEAIEGPCERYAAWAREGRGGHEVALEPGLAEQVRDELVVLSERRRADAAGPASGNGHGARGGSTGVDAAFLQLVMRRLWDEDVAAAGGSTIRLATLSSLGGAEEIVATHLDDALASLPASEQALAAELLRFLVTPSGATACLTALDLADYAERPVREVEALAEKLSRPPARILRGVGSGESGTGTEGYELPQVLAEPAVEWRTRRRTARLEERARLLLLALVAMTATAIALVAYTLQPRPLHRLELAAVDARFELRGARAPDSRIVMVTLDDAAYERSHRKGAPPPRATYARAIEAIAGAQPRAVAVDIIFTSAGSDAGADDALFGTITGPAGERLVLATDSLNEHGESELLGSSDATLGDHGNPDRDIPRRPLVGYAGFPRALGSDVARRIERGVAVLDGTPLGTLAVTAARLGGGVRPSRLPSSAWIDYRGPNGTYPRIAFYDVLRRDPAALRTLRGRIVLLGNAASQKPDVHGTSAPGPSLMDGPEIQANAISTALDGLPLRDGGRVLDILLILALGLLPAGLALRMRAAVIAPACLGACALFCGAAQLAFAGGRVISVVFPLASLALAAVGVGGVLVLRGRRRLASPPAARHEQPAPAPAPLPESD